MNTGVGSLSLLQGIFPTQESNRTGQVDSFLPMPRVQKFHPDIPWRALLSFLTTQWTFSN